MNIDTLLHLWKNLSPFRQVTNHQILLSRHMGKPKICIGENKGANQLRSNFRFTVSTMPLLSSSKISSLSPSPVTVQASLCRTCSEPKLLVFPCTDSFVTTMYICLVYFLFCFKTNSNSWNTIIIIPVAFSYTRVLFP